MSETTSIAVTAFAEPIRCSDTLSYYQMARKALVLEQAEEYAIAAKIWTKANKISCNTLNQHWTEKRAEFCLKQKDRRKS